MVYYSFQIFSLETCWKIKILLTLKYIELFRFYRPSVQYEVGYWAP